MSKIVFHKCRICGRVFYRGNKDSYCVKCVPSFPGGEQAYSYAINNMSVLQKKRAMERERWHRRMANPVFKEHERLRSLARSRAERKYAVKEEDE